jgi:hydrogenase maturation factor HypF (carbamoyltransferase family)
MSRQFGLRILFARLSRQLQKRIAASFETFFDARSAAISQSKMAKFNLEIPQTVEKLKYRDANKEFHKMAISLRCIAFGEMVAGKLTAAAAIMQKLKVGGIGPGRSLYL